jgi:anti-sigma factor RsiW
MTDEDAELVALIDNELDESSRDALLARLATDEGLRQRYDELRAAGAPIAASLEKLLGQAPLERLRAAIPADGPARQPRPGRSSGFALRDLAAGIAIGLLAAGAAAWVAMSAGLFGEPDNWRLAVAEYADLYTDETFSPLNPDASLQATELNAVGAKVGANLTPGNVALPGLRFTVAFMLSYEGSPLGLIAYVDPSGAPVLLCILAHETPDASMRSERRGDLSLALWSRSGRSHLVIGRIPEERAVALAQTIEKRI